MEDKTIYLSRDSRIWDVNVNKCGYCYTLDLTDDKGKEIKIKMTENAINILMDVLGAVLD